MVGSAPHAGGLPELGCAPCSRPLHASSPPLRWPLQALHIEENSIQALPAGAYLGGLRELLLDWHTALGSAAALRAATQLSRLVLGPWVQVDDTTRPPGAAVGEQLLAALAAMPALRLVEEAFSEARCARPRRSPCGSWGGAARTCTTCLCMLEDGNVGWTLSAMVAGMPQNAGMRLIQ